jgi:hypothetical protein
MVCNGLARKQDLLESIENKSVFFRENFYKK